MHRFINLVVILFCFSCITKKSYNQLYNDVLFLECPGGGTCSLEILKDTSISLIRDEFDNLYPKPTLIAGVNLIKISYIKDIRYGIMDANYVEVFYIVVPKSKKKWKLKNKALFNANLIYGRECRCPGETGFKYLSEGKLNYLREGNRIHIDLKAKNTSLNMLMNKLSLRADVIDVF